MYFSFVYVSDSLGPSSEHNWRCPLKREWFVSRSGLWRFGESLSVFYLCNQWWKWCWWSGGEWQWGRYQARWCTLDLCARWTCVHGARWTCVHGERSSGLSWRQASAGGVGTKWPLTKWARWTGWLLTKWTSGQGYRVILLFSPNYSYRGQVGGVVKVRKQFLSGYLMIRSVKWQTWTITRWETKISFFILVLYVFNKV